MPTGSIILWKADKGYGFIRPKDSEFSGDNVYLHVSALQAVGLETINVAQRVSYELQTGENGKVAATDIKLLD